MLIEKSKGFLTALEMANFTLDSDDSPVKRDRQTMANRLTGRQESRLSRR